MYMLSGLFSHCVSFQLYLYSISLCFFYTASVVSSGEEIQSGSGYSHLVLLPAQHSVGVSREQTICTQVGKSHTEII